MIFVISSTMGKLNPKFFSLYFFVKRSCSTGVLFGRTLNEARKLAWSFSVHQFYLSVSHFQNDLK